MHQISYNPKIWYIIGSIFPIVSVGVCWAIFYGTGHFKNGWIDEEGKKITFKQKVLDISVTVVPYPENKIFPVTMCIEAVIILFLYLMRNNIIVTYSEKYQLNSMLYKTIRFLMYLATIAVPLGLVFLSILTLQNQKFLHLCGAFVFFGGSCIYYLITDFYLRKMSYGKTFVASILVLIALALLCLFSMIDNSVIDKFSSVFQYLLALTIFAKIFCMQYDVPQHFFTVSL